MRSSDDLRRSGPAAPCGLADMLASPPASPASNKPVYLRGGWTKRPPISEQPCVGKYSLSRSRAPVANLKRRVRLAPVCPRSEALPDERKLCRYVPGSNISLLVFGFGLISAITS